MSDATQDHAATRYVEVTQPVMLVCLAPTEENAEAKIQKFLHEHGLEKRGDLYLSMGSVDKSNA